MTETSFKIERQPPLAERVYAGIRDMIHSAAFQPGERLTEDGLAKRLAVSRTPVREALFRLESVGLVEQEGGKFVVPRLSLRDIHEIFELRRALEPLVIARIATDLSDADLAAFRQGLGALQAAEGVEAATQANIAFRKLWMDRITNGRVREVLARVDDQVVLVRRTTLNNPAARDVALDCARDLVEALAMRDSAAASRAMEKFIDAALAFFEAAVSGETTQAINKGE